MMHSTTKENGFTIVEVLVALVLLSISVLMTLMLTTQNQDALSKIYFQETATILAQKKLFELEQQGVTATTTAAGDFGEHHPDFSWKANVYSTVRPSTNRLQLKVMWGEKRNHSVTIEKVFTE
ncbi:prepilin-type N-terminal cleavage/methylation domain-containing protein [Halodesulfovibrio marinisediminis]|nr:prepilin-type N-terminal cleavage/methylation domain-containing protein [Halodesulfovibrio marinisediminis]